MLILEGVLLALGGAVAGLAGLTGLARNRRLRRDGLTAWATIVPALRGDDEPERISVQFALADGRVIERSGGRRARPGVGAGSWPEGAGLVRPGGSR